MITVFGWPDVFDCCVVMTDSLHRDWPGQVQWVCSQPPHLRGPIRAPGGTPASRQFLVCGEGDARIFFATRRVKGPANRIGEFNRAGD
jgi:hypothetical protein